MTTNEARFVDLAETLHAAFPGRLTLTYDPPQGVLALWQPEASPAEQSQYDGIVAGWDWSAAAAAAADAAKHRERTDLREQAAAAAQAIDTYLEIASPTQAQVRDQVRLLSQAMRRLV